MKPTVIRDFWVRRPAGWVLPLVAVTLFIRKGDALLNPQFWAEDGTVFFLQQYEHGAGALFQAYSGYLHLVPRLLAWLADSVAPYASIPAFYAYSCLILTLTVTAAILSPRLTVPHQPLMALAVVLIPHFTNEVFLNLTNLQWILSLALITVLMKEEPAEKYGPLLPQRAGDLGVVILCGLTGPFVVFLLPFFLEKWIRSKSTHHALLFATASLVGFIQMRFMVASLRRLPGPKMSLETLSAILGHRVMGDLFLGSSHHREIDHRILSVLLVVLLTLFLVVALRRRFHFLGIPTGVTLVLLGATLYKFQSHGEVLIPSGAAARYFYIPCLMLTWSFIVLGKEPRWGKPLLAGAMILILTSSFRSQFRSPPMKDRHWKTYCAAIGKEEVVIPINPKGWKIVVKPTD